MQTYLPQHRFSFPELLHLSQLFFLLVRPFAFSFALCTLAFDEPNRSLIALWTVAKPCRWCGDRTLLTPRSLAPLPLLRLLLRMLLLPALILPEPLAICLEHLALLFLPGSLLTEHCDLIKHNFTLSLWQVALVQIFEMRRNGGLSCSTRLGS